MFVLPSSTAMILMCLSVTLLEGDMSLGDNFSAITGKGYIQIVENYETSFLGVATCR